MKTFPKILIGCSGVTALLLIVLVIGLWKFTGFVGKFFSGIEFTTGPPSKAPSIPDGYQVEGDVVYYTRNSNFFGNWVPNRTVLKDVDLKTFKTLDSYLRARDATHVYYEGVAIPGADPATYRSSDSRYSGDAGHTYYDGKVIPGARGQDADSVIVDLDFMRARDKHHVYYEGAIIEGADGASFELIGGSRISRDKNDYYTSRSDGEKYRMVGLQVHMPTFKMLIPTTLVTTGGFNPWNSFERQLWAYDNQRYYVGDTAFPIADPSTFVVLPFGYAKDSKQAYYLDKVIPDADLTTFQVVSPDHDKNWGQEFGCYAKDAKRVYFQARVIEGADVATFTVVDERFFKDKNHRYLFGRVEDGEQADERAGPRSAG
jgi:hypothetical protein